MPGQYFKLGSERNFSKFLPIYYSLSIEPLDDIQCLSFIAIPHAAAVLHRKLESAGTSRDICDAENNNTRNALYDMNQ